MTSAADPSVTPPFLPLDDFDAVAVDGHVGHIVRPVYRPGEDTPTHLVIQLDGLHRRRMRSIPVSFVEGVDARARRVRLGVRRRTVAHLPAGRLSSARR